jgi:NAD-dependent deacetylase
MNIVFYTGAGISAESGVPTFRSSKALWAEHNPAIVAQTGGWLVDQRQFTDFWDKVTAEYKAANFQPTIAHKLIRKFERNVEKRKGGFGLITTNVDDLHEKAGSKNLFKIHGCMSRTRVILEDVVIPDVVLFGEEKMHEEQTDKLLDDADVLIVVGSSLSIGGDSSMLFKARHKGTHCIELNSEPTGHPAFDEVLNMPATVGLPILHKRFDELYQKRQRA